MDKFYSVNVQVHTLYPMISLTYSQTSISCIVFSATDNYNYTGRLSGTIPTNQRNSGTLREPITYTVLIIYTHIDFIHLLYKNLMSQSHPYEYTAQLVYTHGAYRLMNISAGAYMSRTFSVEKPDAFSRPHINIQLATLVIDNCADYGYARLASQLASTQLHSFNVHDSHHMHADESEKHRQICH